jgi:hypothetical protein
MSITAAKVRTPLMRLCAAPLVPGPCNPVPAADVSALPGGHEYIRGGIGLGADCRFFRWNAKTQLHATQELTNLPEVFFTP